LFEVDVFVLQGHRGERDSGLCGVRRTTVILVKHLSLNCSLGSIQVRSEYSHGFGCQKIAQRSNTPSVNSRENTAPTCQYGRCWLADPQGAYV